MSFFSFLSRKPTANVARERLQILLAHERATFGGNADLVAVLQEEILAVIAKHISVEREKVQIKLDRGDSFSTLEIGVEIPPGLAEKQASAKKAALRAS
ncbi:MAG TPA: cell division topological specificity factor MinE [Acidisoma sp.]|jgi:cell division topological specificity factor|uniref:cell division topological specificity factor MinE n=1 Tax=Acidisoma sp. TaxID=1872115 RepID=UPI002C270E58|nr:cell division topological specificity factor MinE [Acidisoma sp.]HTI01031.1 cell division topological specificity factor MinE [Acidisoma sp.]